MNVFLTGGTGLIGSAVVAELLANDHSILALARSEASALALKSAGAEPVRGDLADLDALRSGAAESDGVIHLAFSHDFSSPDAIARAVAEESSALATLGEELLGRGRDQLARRRRRGRRGAGHRRSHRPAARAASRDGASGNLRSARPDLRHRPARLQHPHTEDARLGTDTPEPPGGPREHPGLTNETESRDPMEVYV